MSATKPKPPDYVIKFYELTRRSPDAALDELLKLERKGKHRPQLLKGYRTMLRKRFGFKTPEELDQYILARDAARRLSGSPF